jgi:hypothetical protein
MFGSTMNVDGLQCATREAARDSFAEVAAMSVRIIYWEEDGGWLGYLRDYPDYWTQGETLDELKENLRDLHRDISEG